MAGGSESEIEALEQDVREAVERLAQAARQYMRAAGRPSPFLLGRDAPGIEQAQVADAKVFAHRVEMLSLHPKGGVVAEVGTLRGDFARSILHCCTPDALHLFDKRFRNLAADVRDHPATQLHQGESSTQLALVDDGFFDWIYIDGDHSYEGVTRDIEQAVRTLKPGGTLVFNDYVRWSHATGVPYGIIPAVNELIHGGWHVVGFALSASGYPDIAVKPPGVLRPGP